MPLSFSCPNCGKPFQVDESLAGKKARCKQCQGVLQIPAAKAAETPSSAPRDRTIARGGYQEPASTSVTRKERKSTWERVGDAAKWFVAASFTVLVGASLAALTIPQGALFLATALLILGIVWLAWGLVWTVLTPIDALDPRWGAFRILGIFRLILLAASWTRNPKAFFVALMGALMLIGGYELRKHERGRILPAAPLEVAAAPQPQSVAATAAVNQTAPPPVVDTEEPPPAERVNLPAEPTAPAQPGAEYAAERLLDLPPANGFDRDRFRGVAPAGGYLVGIRVSYVDAFGGSKIGSVQPVFQVGDSRINGDRFGGYAETAKTAVAKPGYAVGGFHTHTGLLVDGFAVVFMRLKGDRLEPDDSYTSPWLGDEKGGSPGSVVTDGRLVVGIQGRCGKEVNALGIVVVK